MPVFALRCFAVLFALALITGTSIRVEAHGSVVMSGHECCGGMDMNSSTHQADQKTPHKGDLPSCCADIGCSVMASFTGMPLIESEPASAVTAAFYTGRQTHSAGIEPNPSLDPPRPSA